MSTSPSVYQRRRPPTAEELTQIPWLALLQADERAQIVPQLVVSDPQAGDYVCRVGRPVTYWFGVISGLLKMSSDNEQGHTMTFTGVPPGGWFGEGTVLKRESYRYNIQALRASVVAGLPVLAVLTGVVPVVPLVPLVTGVTPPAPAVLLRWSAASAALALAWACSCGSKKHTVLRPVRLAWYMARSACLSRSSTPCPPLPTWPQASPCELPPEINSAGHDVAGHVGFLGQLARDALSCSPQ